MPAPCTPTALGRPAARSHLALGAALLLGAGSVLAGRPLATDDASTADVGECQVEAWAERSRSQADAAGVLAPACGVRDGWELGGEWVRFQAGQALRSAASLGLKWVPAGAALDTALGPVALGLKVSLGYEQSAGQGWRHTSADLLALATWRPLPTLALHANLGPQHHAHEGRHSSHLRLAVAWTPHPAALLFAEAQAQDLPGADGANVKSLGGRWWLLPERLGLDLSASRAAAAGAVTRWSVGLGWYGIGR